MKEQEWLACRDPQPMLHFLWGKSGKRKWPQISERKERLFACACCRRIWHRFVDERSRKAVEVAEKCADGNVTQEEMTVAAARAYDAATDDRAYNNDCVAAPEYAALDTIGVYDSTGAVTTMVPSFFSLNAAYNAASSIANRANLESPDEDIWEAVFAAEREAQAVLLRDLLGNPFHPVAFHHSWFTTKVNTLAQAIYDDRAFDRLPILAAALEEAGCTNVDILDHCRKPGEHVRGCWAVDLLLGKE